MKTAVYPFSHLLRLSCSLRYLAPRCKYPYRRQVNEGCSQYELCTDENKTHDVMRTSQHRNCTEPFQNASGPSDRRMLIAQLMELGRHQLKEASCLH
eukprot:755290-Hanusia_phi.AAC.3